MENNWQEINLNKVCNIYQPKTITSKDISNFGLYKVFGANGIIGYFDKYNHEESEVLMTCRGATCGTINLSEPKSWITGNAMVIQPKNINYLNKMYLYYFLQYINPQSLISGSAQPQITRQAFIKIKIPTPLFKIQRKIALILSTVDEEIQKTEQIIERTEKLKNGLMNELLTKGIGHTKFKKTKIGEIPENWSIELLSNTDIQIIDGDRGINYPKKDEFQNSGYCLFLSNKNIINDTFNFDESIFISQKRDNLLRKGKLQRYDVVLTTRGTVGNVAFFDNSVPYSEIRINSGMLIFRAGKSFDPQFLYFLMKSSLMKKIYFSLGSGSAQPQLPISSLKNLQIAVPPISEQQEIASMFQFFDDKYKNEKEHKKKLVNIKNGLMNDIFSQKVEVKNVA